ncbi:hypothetical protein GX48_06792 [Paracoccidioides brasiliensis]|nr:hypothetical protein GX48_06792 [Paracoccidioides brasiliensis]
MAADLDAGEVLAVIKCSKCNASVGISEMGDHTCSRPSQQLTPPPDQDSHNPFRGPTYTAGFNREGKSGRLGPPPRINPFAANHHFKHRDLLTPANSDGTPSLSPLPLKRSQTTPISPAPEPANEDDSYTCVRSHTVAGSGMRSGPGIWTPATGGVFTRMPFENSPDRIEDDAISEYCNNNLSILRSPAPDASENRCRPRSTNRHRREVSIDNKSILRMSTANSRFGDSGLGSYSPRNLSIGGRNVMDEVPPLPTGPIKSFTPGPCDAIPSSYRFESKEDFEKDRVTGASPPKNQQKKGVFGSSDFGLPSQPKLPRNPEDGTILRQPSNATTNSTTSSRSFRYVVQEKGIANKPEYGPSMSPTHEYRIDQDFSVSNFARDLGLSHSTHPSISSTGTTLSDMTSGSSHSTRPSEVSNETSPLKSASGNLSSWDSSTLDLEPSRPDDLFGDGVDSPTDPSFQNGHLLSMIWETDRSNGSGSKLRSGLPPEPTVNDARSPPTQALTRNATRTPTGRRNRCRGCQQIIVGKSISSADGRLTGRWHKACFVCYTCRSPFQTADFYVLDNLPYCAQHYHELNGSLCGACNTGIEGQCLETEEETDNLGGGTRKKYHPDCFKCRTCSMVLRGDYFEWNGIPYCEQDGRCAASATYPPQPSHMMPPEGGSGYNRWPSHSPAGGYPGGYGPGPGAGPRNGPGGSTGMRYPSSNSNLRVPPQGMTYNGRRYPERRTTKLMMI